MNTPLKPHPDCDDCKYSGECTCLSDADDDTFDPFEWIERDIYRHNEKAES